MLPAALTNIHGHDHNSAEFFKDHRTFCGLPAKGMNRSLHLSQVNCPECLASDDYRAQSMEEALVPVWQPPDDEQRKQQQLVEDIRKYACPSAMSPAVPITSQPAANPWALNPAYAAPTASKK
jgi:hypothetical protein